MRDRFRLLFSRATIAVAALVCVGLVPIPRDTVAPWAVVVRDRFGLGIEGVTVGQVWYDYTFGLHGLRSDRTDAAGRLVFPRVRTYRPMAVLMLMAAPSFVNVHRGFGRQAFVNVAVDGSEADLKVVGDGGCRSHRCMRPDLSVTFVLTPFGPPMPPS